MTMNTNHPNIIQGIFSQNIQYIWIMTGIWTENTFTMAGALVKKLMTGYKTCTQRYLLLMIKSFLRYILLSTNQYIDSF